MAFVNLNCVLILLYLSSTVRSRCNFPSSWSGDWFQKGFPDSIKVSVDRYGSGHMAGKGVCTESSSGKFLFEDTVEAEKCVRCVAMHQRHINVLQYKESSCIPVKERHDLARVCEDIPGDAPRNFLFRLGATPIACPFNGYFKFSYNRGRGECRDPPSTIDSCTDDKHLLFQFQACIDVKGSESKVEMLECYAEWKEGSTHYLVGQTLNPLAKTGDDKFRCFIIEAPNSTVFHVGQSADATCEGFSTWKDAPTSMEMIKSEKFDRSCSFPDWIKTTWTTLDHSHTYFFHQNDSTFTVRHKYNESIIKIGHCYQKESHDTFIVHSTAGCDIGYVCMKMVNRSENIIEMLISDLTKTISDACTNLNRYDQSDHLILTKAISRIPPSLDCPLKGIYDFDLNLESEVSISLKGGFGGLLHLCSRTTVAFQCDAPSYMRLTSTCKRGSSAKSFQCIGGWKAMGTNYLIVSSPEDRVDLCLGYVKTDSGAVRMSLSGTNCRLPSRNRNIPPQFRNNPSYNLNDNNDNEYSFRYNRNAMYTKPPQFTESIQFDLSEKGLCHATGQALSNSHIRSHFALNLFMGLLFVFGCLRHITVFR
ncbi:argus [Brevipalpus obovatus]|uniref:argus n=1 Tax=Brevipalpus obovatus TaxID=246614 RepID=UPI003D9EFB89